MGALWSVFICFAERVGWRVGEGERGKVRERRRRREKRKREEVEKIDERWPSRLS